LEGARRVRKILDIDLETIRPGDAVVLRCGQSTIAGAMHYGPYGELCVTLIGQSITFARPNRADRLKLLPDVKLIEHQAPLW
jgi:hypothetical protein